MLKDGLTVRSLTSWLTLLATVFSINVLSGQSTSEQDTAKAFSFVPVPYLSYDRNLGFSFGAVPLAMYRMSAKDTVSEESLSGLVGFYTTNKSWFAMGFNRTNFGFGKWRFVGAYGLGNFNYQFFLSGIINDFVPYTTGAQFLQLQVLRRVWKDIFVGALYSWTKFDTEFDSPIPIQTEANLHGIGSITSWDTRENQYYPIDGFEAKASYRSYPGFIGNEFISNRIELEHNHFFPAFLRRDVVGVRAFAGVGIGDLSFNQQFLVNNKDIRGYTQGQFRGDQMIAVQGEYRWNFHPKFGAVGFFGLATVLSSINEEDNGRILPGLGVGARYSVFPKNSMNVGFDFAVGVEDWGIYFRIGEAF